MGVKLGCAGRADFSGPAHPLLDRLSHHFAAWLRSRGPSARHQIPDRSPVVDTVSVYRRAVALVAIPPVIAAEAAPPGNAEVSATTETMSS